MRRTNSDAFSEVTVDVEFALCGLPCWAVSGGRDLEYGSAMVVSGDGVDVGSRHRSGQAVGVGQSDSEVLSQEGELVVDHR